jgi:hypothetical protein
MGSSQLSAISYLLRAKNRKLDPHSLLTGSGRKQKSLKLTAES